MERPGHIQIVLRTGEALTHVPSHMDFVAGAARQISKLDGGSIDRILRGRGDGFRALGVYHARESLGKIGEQHTGYDDLEEHLGFSRTYRVEIADPSRTHDVIHELRRLPHVEVAITQTLATTPFSVTLADTPTGTKGALREAWLPHEMIHAKEAHAMEPGDSGVLVAVVDTGVSLGHPELQRKLLAGYDTVDLGIGALSDDMKLVGDSRGPNFTPMDQVGHGSHCAGEIGAQGWHIPPGVGGKAMILPVRVLAAAIGARGRRMGIGSLPDINAGIKVAVDLGADVINMSLGTPESAVDPHGPKPHAPVVRYADHYGVVLVAAAGNSGQEEKFYPAALPEVIAVGSVDKHGNRSHFSTFGSHLALSAPGEGIISIGRHGYRRSSGTSHAAPLVSGVAALLVSQGKRLGRSLNGADVRAILTASAQSLSGGQFSHETGYGLVNALAALQYLNNSGNDKGHGRI